ncbi:hypothetical protein [Pseudomonas ogarae]
MGAVLFVSTCSYAVRQEAEPGHIFSGGFHPPVKIVTATLQAGIKKYLLKKSMVLQGARLIRILFFDRFNFVAFFQAKAIAAGGP